MPIVKKLLGFLRAKALNHTPKIIRCTLYVKQDILCPPPESRPFYRILMNFSGLSTAASPSLLFIEAGPASVCELNMSFTVFLAMCVLGVDFVIFFFFKLVYGEKRRISPRRLPSDYHRRPTQSSKGTRHGSPLVRVPARKDRPIRPSAPPLGITIGSTPARMPSSTLKPEGSGKFGISFLIFRRARL